MSGVCFSTQFLQLSRNRSLAEFFTPIPEVGVAQNSSQISQIAQVAQLRNLRCALCFFFRSCAICVALFACFFSACAICVALYAFFSALAQFAFANR